MKRRNFFRPALALSLTFATPSQQLDLQKWTELLSPTRASLSIGEELSVVETLTQTCWQLHPHLANVVERCHLDYVAGYRDVLQSWLQNSPGSPIDSRLASALSEVAQVEGGLLYELKRLTEAETAYRYAVQLAQNAGNAPLEAIGLTRLSNFLIDVGQAGKASAPVEAARKIAKKGGATPLVQAWIRATEADAWANQPKVYGTADKCEAALEEAARWTDARGTEQERYPVPYDAPWLFGYRGTVYAHLGRPQEAQRELEQGLRSLGPTSTFRQWGFYKDLLIAHSLEKNGDEACHCARLAMNIAQHTKALMYLQRTQDITQQVLKPWKESPLVKDLMEEFRVAQQKLAVV